MNKDVSHVFQNWKRCNPAPSSLCPRPQTNTFLTSGEFCKLTLSALLPVFYSSKWLWETAIHVRVSSIHITLNDSVPISGMQGLNSVGSNIYTSGSQHFGQACCKLSPTLSLIVTHIPFLFPCLICSSAFCSLHYLELCFLPLHDLLHTTCRSCPCHLLYVCCRLATPDLYSAQEWENHSVWLGLWPRRTLESISFQLHRTLKTFPLKSTTEKEGTFPTKSAVEHFKSLVTELHSLERKGLVCYEYPSDKFALPMNLIDWLDFLIRQKFTIFTFQDWQNIRANADLLEWGISRQCNTTQQPSYHHPSSCTENY